MRNVDTTVGASGRGEIRIAVIDGPYDGVTLSRVLAQTPVSLGPSNCSINPSSACDHGTFIMGLLGARSDALIPGLCPDCRLLHIPLFVDERSPWASVGELANAIRIALVAGARLINLSLAILGDDGQTDDELAAALDDAEACGAVVVVAAGNQGRPAVGQLLSHPVTVPVAAMDAAQRPLPDCNFGAAIARRGISALGRQVFGYAPGGGTTVMSGTSVATAVATGTLAELWAAHPDVNGAEIRAAVARLGPRNGSAPPILDRDVLGATLNRMGMATIAPVYLARRDGTNHVSLQGERKMNVGNELPRFSSGGLSRTAISDQAAVPASGSAGCACDTPGGVCTCPGNQGDHSGFVYAIGTIEIHYPTVAVEREMQIVAHELGVVPPTSDRPDKLTEDREWQYKVLSKEGAHYIARQLSWRLTIEDIPRFILKPRDSTDLHQLIDSLKYPKFAKPDGHGGKNGVKANEQKANNEQKGKRAKLDSIDPLFRRPQDLDVVVGVVGSQAPQGIEVLTDQVFRTETGQLGLPGSDKYFDQLADNFGLDDGDRAYNFLVARYAIPPEGLEEIQKGGLELAGVPTIYSRLGGDTGRVVRVIFSFNSKGSKTPAEIKYFVRVDVTDRFPFIVTPWHRYLERGEQS